MEKDLKAIYVIKEPEFILTYYDNYKADGKTPKIQNQRLSDFDIKMGNPVKSVIKNAFALRLDVIYSWLTNIDGNEINKQELKCNYIFGIETHNSILFSNQFNKEFIELKHSLLKRIFEEMCDYSDKNEKIKGLFSVPTDSQIVSFSNTISISHQN